jgi:hypothetical protein
MKAGKQKPGSAKRKTHPLELKLEVLHQLKAGATVSDVCRAFKLTERRGAAVLSPRGRCSTEPGEWLPGGLRSRTDFSR